MKHKPVQAVPHERLFSLDALRGFDMFWITGGGYLVAVLAKYTGAGWLKVLADLKHVFTYKRKKFQHLDNDYYQPVLWEY